MSGSPLGFILFCLEDRQLASNDGRSLHVGLDQCPVGWNGLAFGKFLDLCQHKRCVILARNALGIRLLEGFLNDNVHFCLGYSRLHWNWVGKEQTRLDLHLVLSV